MVCADRNVYCGVMVVVQKRAVRRSCRVVRQRRVSADERRSPIVGAESAGAREASSGGHQESAGIKIFFFFELFFRPCVSSATRVSQARTLFIFFRRSKCQD